MIFFSFSFPICLWNYICACGVEVGGGQCWGVGATLQPSPHCNRFVVFENQALLTCISSNHSRLIMYSSSLPREHRWLDGNIPVSQHSPPLLVVTSYTHTTTYSCQTHTAQDYKEQGVRKLTLSVMCLFLSGWALCFSCRGFSNDIDVLSHLGMLSFKDPLSIKDEKIAKVWFCFRMSSWPLQVSVMLTEIKTDNALPPPSTVQNWHISGIRAFLHGDLIWNQNVCSSGWATELCYLIPAHTATLPIASRAHRSK